MKGLSDWINVFETNVFKTLKSQASTNFNLNDLSLSKNVLAFRDSDVLIWNENSLSLYCINLKSFVADQNLNYCQEFVWNNRPKFEVHKIYVSPTESQLALCGSDGIQILTLPTVRGKHGLFKDGAKTITCYCVTVDEKYFVSSGTKLLCCKWHPGFSSPNVLFVLTFENFFRIYNADNHFEPITIVDLNSISNFSVSSKNVLGESFVSFDFSNSCEASLNSSQLNAEGPSLFWTAYLLVGNGQVCSCSIMFDGRSSFKHILHGPLKMYPPAEDNYGCDACSILFIDTMPSVLVVATCEGKLHHCILLSSENNDELSGEDKSDNDTSIRQISQWSPVEMSLYVYETVELELSLRTARLDDSFDKSSSDIDPFSCPIQLYRDPVTKQRYHCCHISGLHSILLTWLYRFEEFFSDEDVTINQSNQEEQCIVEHLLCTKPLLSSSLTPIIGFTQVADTFLGSKVVCLTADYQTSIFPLLQSYRTSTRPLSIENPTDFQMKTHIPFREDLSDKISKILFKKSTNPIIKGSLSSTSTPQECFKLLCRATQVFREEYIQKYDQARVELDRNIFRLQKMKSRQVMEVNELRNDYGNITQKQESIREKLKMVMERQSQLCSRLNNASQKIEKSISVLSESEENMMRNLKDFQQIIEGQEKTINHLKKKSEHQLKEIRQSNSAAAAKDSGNMVTEEKANSIRLLLKKEGDDIVSLKKDLKNIQNLIEI